MTLTNKGTLAAQIYGDRDRAVHDCRRREYLLGQDHRSEEDLPFDVEFAPAKVADVTGGLIETSQPARSQPEVHQDEIATTRPVMKVPPRRVSQ